MTFTNRLTQPVKRKILKECSYWLLIDADGDESISEPDDYYTIEEEFYRDERQDDFVIAKEVKLNVNDCWIGYFYYNDDEVFDIDTASKYPFNTREHLQSFWERNPYQGHYVWGRIEHIVNGVVVETEDEEVNW